MGGKSTTSTTTNTPPPYVADAYKNVVAKAQNIYDTTSYTPFSGGTTNPLIDSANATLGNAANAGQGNFAQASSDINASTTPSYQNVQNYMNPYTSGVVNATMANMNEQNGEQQQGVIGNAIAKGAMGGDRVGVAQGELARQQNLANQQTIAGLWNQDYSQALGASQQQQQQMLQAGNAQAGLGTAATTADVQAGLAGLQGGENQYNRDYAAYQAQQSYPYQKASWLSSIATGIGQSAGGTSSSTTPQGNGASSLFGGVLGLGSMLMSDERAKEDIEPIGKTFDGQTLHRFRYKGDPTTHVGLMAQEVEQRHPEAVGDIGGLKGVDYHAATNAAAGKGGFYAGGGVIPYDQSPASTFASGADASYVPTANPAGGGGGGTMPKAPNAPQQPDQAQQALTAAKQVHDLGNAPKTKIGDALSNMVHGPQADGGANTATGNYSDSGLAQQAASSLNTPAAAAAVPAAAGITGPAAGGLGGVLSSLAGFLSRGGAVKGYDDGGNVPFDDMDALRDSADASNYNTVPALGVLSGQVQGPPIPPSNTPLPPERPADIPTSFKGMSADENTRLGTAFPAGQAVAPAPTPGVAPSAALKKDFPGGFRGLVQQTPDQTPGVVPGAPVAASATAGLVPPPGAANDNPSLQDLAGKYPQTGMPGGSAAGWAPPVTGGVIPPSQVPLPPERPEGQILGAPAPAATSGRSRTKVKQDPGASFMGANASDTGGVTPIYGGPTSTVAKGVYQPPQGATGTDAMGRPMAKPPAFAGDWMTNFQNQGLDPMHAAILAGNVQQESNFNSGAINPKEGAHGALQWRQDRWTNLQNFAAKQGTDWRDPQTQAAFAVWEGQHTEQGPWQQFLAAKDPTAANAALKRFIRYGDDSQGTRLQNGLALMHGGSSTYANATNYNDAGDGKGGGAGVLGGAGAANDVTGSTGAPQGGVVQPNATPAQQKAGGILSSIRNALGGENLLSDDQRLALMNAGFGMMAGKSSNPFVNIGEGAQKGVETYMQSQKNRREQQIAESDIGYKKGMLGLEGTKTDLEGKRLAQEADLKRQELAQQSANISSQIQERQATMAANRYDVQPGPNGFMVRDKYNPLNVRMITPEQLQAGVADGSLPPPSNGSFGAPPPADNSNAPAPGGGTPMLQPPAQAPAAPPVGSGVPTPPAPAPVAAAPPAAPAPQGFEGLQPPVGREPMNMNQFRPEGQKIYGEMYKDQVTKLRDAATAAQSTNLQLDQVENDLATASKSGVTTPGAGFANRVAAARAVNTAFTALGFGAPIDQAAVAAGEAAIKGQNQLGFELAKTLGSREAGFIVQQAVNTVPGGALSPEGSKILIASIRAANQRKIDLANYVQKWGSQNGFDTTNAEATFNKYAPPALYTLMATKGPNVIPAVQRLRQHPEKAAEFDAAVKTPGAARLALGQGEIIPDEWQGTPTQ